MGKICWISIVLWPTYCKRGRNCLQTDTKRCKCLHIVGLEQNNIICGWCYNIYFVNSGVICIFTPHGTLFGPVYTDIRILLNFPFLMIPMKKSFHGGARDPTPGIPLQVYHAKYNLTYKSAYSSSTSQMHGTPLQLLDL